jgi:hypothetical protein
MELCEFHAVTVWCDLTTDQQAGSGMVTDWPAASETFEIVLPL